MSIKNHCAFSVLSLIAWISIAGADEPSISRPVQNTFDNQSFSYLEKSLAERPGYKILRLQYPSPLVTEIKQNNTIPADYYFPEGIHAGDPKRPAVICLHILDGNDALTDLLCSSLAARGIPAIAFKLPYYGERGLADGPMAMARDPKLFASAIEQTGYDVRRTFDLLASRPEVDSQKIGIAGISLGGIISASVAGGEPRIHRAALLLAGGDVLDIIGHARETKPILETMKAMPAEERTALEAKIAAGDPLKFASNLRDRAQKGQVLMINATDDEVIPKRCTEKLADALAIPDKIIWLDGLGHYTSMAELPFALKTMTDFFALDLPSGVVPPSTESRSREMKKLAGVLQQAATILADTPQKGKCCCVEMQVSITSDKDAPLGGRACIRRDSDKSFSLACKLPIFGEISLGQNDYPWMVSGGEVLLGTENRTAALRKPMEIIAGRHRLHLRMLAGLLKACAGTPEVLLRFMSVKNDPQPNGTAGIAIVGKPPLSGRISLLFQSDARTPSEIKFETAGVKGSVQFLDLRTDADTRPDFFEPPADRPIKKIEQAQVYRMFDALFSLAESMGG